MRFKQLVAGAIIATGLTAIAAGGCGGDSSSGSSGGANSSADVVVRSVEFLTPGANNKIPKFGDEADVSEREAASAVLEENLRARAAGDWEGQCSSLTADVIKTLERDTAPLNVGKGCAKSLKAAADVSDARAGKTPEIASGQAEGRAEKGPSSIRAYTMTGPIDAFRVRGKKGYALYHGTQGLDFAMKMEKVGGEWKVASLITTEP